MQLSSDRFPTLSIQCHSMNTTFNIKYIWLLNLYSQQQVIVPFSDDVKHLVLERKKSQTNTLHFLLPFCFTVNSAFCNLEKSI